MEIARAESRHLDGILEIERESFADPWSRESLASYLDDPWGELLAALEGDRVLGFAVYYVSFENADLYNIAVRPEARGRGVGTALLGEVLRRARAGGAERMFLEVRRSNLAAQRLYERAGFAVCGVRRNYYTSPTEDAILMEKNLEN